MSFSQNAKLEVLQQEILNDCDSFAFLSGIMKGAGVIRRNKNGVSEVAIYT